MLQVLNKYKFEEVGRVMYIFKAVNMHGDFVRQECKEGDTYVIGFLVGSTVYRGLIPHFLLHLSPSIPEYGKKYRFRGLEKPKKRETHRLVSLISILPTR